MSLLKRLDVVPLTVTSDGKNLPCVLDVCAEGSEMQQLVWVVRVIDILIMLGTLAVAIKQERHFRTLRNKTSTEIEDAEEDTYKTRVQRTATHICVAITVIIQIAVLCVPVDIYNEYICEVG